MEEVNTTEGASDDGIDRTSCALQLNLGTAANVGKYVAFSEFNQCKLSVITVSLVIHGY